MVAVRVFSGFAISAWALASAPRAPQSALRVGDIRVFYDLSGTTVEVLAIVAKSEAESWLAQFGNPE